MLPELSVVVRVLRVRAAALGAALVLFAGDVRLDERADFLHALDGSLQRVRALLLGLELEPNLDVGRVHDAGDIVLGKSRVAQFGLDGACLGFAVVLVETHVAVELPVLPLTTVQRHAQVFGANKVDDRLAVEAEEHLCQPFVDHAVRLGLDVFGDVLARSDTITNYTSIVLGNNSKNNKLKKVEIVHLEENKILTIVITDKGYVEHKNLYLPTTISIEEVRKTVELINKLIVGTPCKWQNFILFMTK